MLRRCFLYIVKYALNSEKDLAIFDTACYEKLLILLAMRKKYVKIKEKTSAIRVDIAEQA